MTDAPTPSVKQNLDMGGIISSTFSTYTKNFGYFFLVFFVPYLILQLIFNFGFGLAAMGADPGIFTSGNSGQFFALTGVSILISILVFFTLQAILVRSAVSAKLGRGVEFGAAVSAALGNLLPIIILGIFATILITLGFMLFIVPGLYVAAMFFVIVPSIVFENRGFGGIGRSVDLTSGYRWSIVGLMLIYFIVSIVIGLVIGLIAGIAIAAFAMSSGDILTATTSTPYLLFMTLLDAVINGLVYPIALIAGGMVFVRLREIKEGGDTADLLKVFE